MSLFVPVFDPFSLSVQDKTQWGELFFAASSVQTPLEYLLTSSDQSHTAAFLGTSTRPNDLNPKMTHRKPGTY